MKKNRKIGMMNNKMLFCGLSFLLASLASVNARLVDTENNAVTNETALGDIDMKKGTFGDLK